MAPSTALFPPGKGGGEGVARGGKGKGILIHSLTAAGGMPLANRTTPANRDERAQVVPLLDAVKVHTGKRGRPRKRLKVIATDKGYDAKALRQPRSVSPRAMPVSKRFQHGASPQPWPCCTRGASKPCTRPRCRGPPSCHGCPPWPPSIGSTARWSPSPHRARPTLPGAAALPGRPAAQVFLL